MSDDCVVGHVTFCLTQVTFSSTEAVQSEALNHRLILQPLTCFKLGVPLKRPVTTGSPLSSAGVTPFTSFSRHFTRLQQHDVLRF